MTTSHETPQDKELDHLVDTTGMSYDEARRHLGITAVPNEFFTAARIVARNEAHQYYSNEFNLSGMPSEEEQSDFFDDRTQALGGRAIEASQRDPEQ